MTLVEGASLVLLDASVGVTTARRSPPSLAGSRWAVEVRGHRNGTLPSLDLGGHGRLLAFVSAIVAEGMAETYSPAPGRRWCRESTTCRAGGWGWR